MTQPKGKPIVLIVRDGWGHNPHREWDHANAIHLAHKPVDDRLLAEYPHTLIHTSGPEVGLPDGVMGNSEVGHQNLGAGRIVEQEIMRITERIHDGTFFSKSAIIGAFECARQSGGNVHITGLCSDGRVHSDLDHLYGLLEMTHRRHFPGDRVFVHAITDGRDSSPHSAVGFLERIEAKCTEYGINPVASVVGRYYAMDRDNRWDRVEQAYRMLTHGEGKRFYTAIEAVCAYYDHPSEPSREGDEFVVPSLVVQRDDTVAQIRDGDAVIFFNFRGDRPREFCKAFVYYEFPYAGEGVDGRMVGFHRGPKRDVYFATMTAYEEGLPVHVVLDKPDPLKDTLGAALSARGLAQFRCAETEKYPHVTFFFNDYRDEPFPNEDWELVPSPRDVTTYDKKPEMSADRVTDLVLRRLAMGKDDFIVVNYANGDMVGHTGVLQAAIRAVETVDHCVGRLVDDVQARGGGLIITADHGNCEQMVDPNTGGPHTAHTTNDVDLILVDERYRGRSLRDGGRLSDVAPTVFEMLGLPKPDAMTGSSLIVPRRTATRAAEPAGTSKHV